MKQDYTLDHEWERHASYPRVTLSPFASYLWENDMLGLFIKLARYKFASRLVGPDDVVVDLGCGDGSGSLFLSQHARKAIGVDIHKPAIDFCQATYHKQNIEFVHSAGEDLGVKEPVDAVVSLDAIEHVPSEVAPKLLENISRILKPSGVLVLGTPSVYSQPYASPNRSRQHYIEYSRETLEELVAPFFGRRLFFSMNDEVVHTGFHKMAWYLFLVCADPLLHRNPSKGLQ